MTTNIRPPYPSDADLPDSNAANSDAASPTNEGVNGKTNGSMTNGSVNGSSNSSTGNNSTGNSSTGNKPTGNRPTGHQPASNNSTNKTTNGSMSGQQTNGASHDLLTGIPFNTSVTNGAVADSRTNDSTANGNQKGRAVNNGSNNGSNNSGIREVPQARRKNEPDDYRDTRYGAERYAPEKVKVTAPSRSALLQWFYDLPVADKQLIGLLGSKILSVAGVIAFSLLLFSITGRQQLLEEAESELIATENDLSRGDADSELLTTDALLLEAATLYSEIGDEGIADSIVADEARQTLRSTLQNRQLEYASLVGPNRRVLASGGADRQGELIDPDGLVTVALSEGRPVMATSLVTLESFQQLGITPPGGTDEAALVRFSVSPILSGESATQRGTDSETVARGEVIGAVVTGDVLDANSRIVSDALGQFPSGYSAIYRRDPSGGFAKVAVERSDDIGVELDIADHQFLQEAIGVSSGEIASERFVGPRREGFTFPLFGPQREGYTFAAKPIVGASGEPVGVVLRGLSENTIGTQQRRNALFVTCAALSAILVDAIIARLLGRSIVKPIRNLQTATEQFSSGDRTARAAVFSRDEVGRVASAFNDLASSVAITETSLRFQSETQSEAAKRAQLLSEFTSQVRRSLDVDSILSTAVDRVRDILEVDRVLIYRFNASYTGGDVTAESVGEGWTQALGRHLEDPMLPNSVDRFKSGQVSFVRDVDKGDLTECHCKLLRELDVKANLVGPIVVGDDLVGLLCAHQCSGPRQWQPEDISLMQQVTTQVGYALAQGRILLSQKQAVKREQQLTNLVTSIRETTDKEQIFRIVTRQIKLAIDTSRVLVYTFDKDWNGTIVAEEVDSQWPAALGAEITDPCFAENYIDQYRTGRVKATTDIYQAGLTQCHLAQLEPFEVRANIVAPIVVEGRLLGLLIAHECEGPREWSDLTINFMQRAATQLGYALEQAEAITQKRLALFEKEELSEEKSQRQLLLEKQLMNLLDNVGAAAQGDLTVRADVEAGEIGTVADFFNVIIENLRQIVTQVKRSANAVNASLGENEGAIRDLAEEALRQAEQTTHTLHSMSEMTSSIRQVAAQAQEAADVAKQASETATAGEEAMDLTVNNILAMRQTVGQTAKKVKRLGESSQQITKAVMLINQIAQQTNLLAINAGIEAAKAGEAGQGFAAVAEEVGELATRSASATDEIERIVDTIQRETNDVVEAIEQSTSQVVEGTRRVEDAKASLNQIIAGSQRVDELARLISKATGSQVETSASVSGLISEIALLSTQTSEASLQASQAMKQTVTVAQNLNEQVATFIVEDASRSSSSDSSSSSNSQQANPQQA